LSATVVTTRLFVDAGSTADDLQLPASRRNSLNPASIWTDYWQQQRRYMETKQALFEKISTHDIKHALNYIWDGDGKNPNAALTVFRHFDSGSVAYGLVGENPETTWVIDYPLFERIHYLLVAGFNVYGNIVHQMNTRIYMDFLRMEGEDHFLIFLADAHERDRSDTDKDTMTVVKWMEGSYPNFFFSVELSEIDTFTKRCAAICNHKDYEKFVGLYDIRRTDTRFWETADWFQDEYARNKPVMSGLFDLNRFQNR